MGRIVWSGTVWLVMAGLYLVLSGTVDAVEIGAALVTASIGTLLSVRLGRTAHRHFRFGVPPRALLRPIAALIPECLLVGHELVAVIVAPAAGQRGGYLQQRFDPGGRDPTSTGRRAVTVLGVSLAPRTFVIRGEREDRLLLHSLPPKPPSDDRMWPA